MTTVRWYTDRGERTGLSVAVQLPVAPIRRRSGPEPCCQIDLCDFRPSRIAQYLTWIETLAQSGWEPAEALSSILVERDLSLGRSAGVGTGTTTDRGAYIVAELSRARKAGKRNPWEIGKFLCPFGVED